VKRVEGTPGTIKSLRKKRGKGGGFLGNCGMHTGSLSQIIENLVYFYILTSLFI